MLELEIGQTPELAAELENVQITTTSDFDELTNRPKYAGQEMTHETDIPEVKKDEWDAKADADDIPTKVSELENDAGYLTEHQDISGKLDKITANRYAVYAHNGTEQKDLALAVSGISEDIPDNNKVPTVGGLVGYAAPKIHNHDDRYRTSADQDIIDASISSEIAQDYDSTATYAVGDYCIHDLVMYRCVTAITTAEEWTVAHWTPVALADDVANLFASAVKGVKVAGTELTKDSDGKVDVPKGAYNSFGVFRIVNTTTGLQVSDGDVSIQNASTTDIDNKLEVKRPITSRFINYAVKSALSANNRIGQGTTEAWAVPALTDEEKDKACIVIGADRHKTQTITIASASWSNNSVTVFVEGVTADNLVQLTPISKADADIWGINGIFCTAQGNGSLTFTCVSVPTASVSLGVVIW